MKGTRKILFSVVALVITLAMAATSTYAWFTVNQGVTVETVNVDVKTGSSLYIRLLDETDADYRTNLTAAQIAGDKGIKKEFSTIKLDALTTTDGNNLFYGNAVSNKPMTASTTKANKNVTYDPDTKTGSYLSFTVKFRSDSEGYIVLDYLPEVTAASGNQLIAHGANAIFSAKLDNQGVPTLSTTATWAEGKYDLGGTLAGTEMTATVTQLTGANQPSVANAARITFNDGTYTTIYDQGFEGKGNKNVQVEYYDKVYGYAGFDIVDGSTEKQTLAYRDNLTPTGLSMVKPATATVAVDSSAAKMANVIATLTPAGGLFEATVTISIWVDGNDSECFNAIFAQTLFANLAFGFAATVS